MSSSSLNALTEYGQRLDRARAQRAVAERKFIQIGNARLILALVAALLAWLAWGEHALSAYTLLLPLVAFMVLVGWHQRVLRERRFADRAIRFYDEALQRVGDNWANAGSIGNSFCDPKHVYADDLDVFGRGSLFQLLSRARTTLGESTLAGWLLTAAEPEQVLSRQTAVQELAGSLSLREDVALLASEVGNSLNPDTLLRWARGAALSFPGFARPFALCLSIAGLATGLACLAGWAPLFVFLLVFLADVIFLVSLRKPLGTAAASLELPAADLDLISLLIGRLEQEAFHTPASRAITEALTIEGASASRRIAKLRRWIEIFDSSDHFFVRVLDPVLLWRAQVTMAIEQWRQLNGPHVANWLRAVGDFEALSSLACLHFERPHWTFPQIDTASPHAYILAESLSHPLLPQSRAVANNLTLGRGTDLVIISGSNMSGKSTLLRAIGLNSVLAWAGAPVCAEKLQLSRLQVGASMRVTDSLQDNRSRFMAEITRLRNIVNLSEHTPVLFLLDELLSGTNSHDRRIGASAIMRNLLASGAVGLLTTHDLALSAIESEVGGRGSNVHFRDTIADGVIQFDYRLHPGVVTRSNALELMRAVGLPV